MGQPGFVIGYPPTAAGAQHFRQPAQAAVRFLDEIQDGIDGDAHRGGFVEMRALVKMNAGDIQTGLEAHYRACRASV